MTDDPSSETPLRREPFFKLPGVILLLLAVMVIVHLVLSFAGERTQLRAVEEFGFVPARFAAGGAAYFGGGTLGLIWPFFTHLFIHGNLAHLTFNGLWLMAVGTPLARRLGTLPFLGFYFLCGIVSAASHLAFNVGSPVPVVGASGAISGCMAGALRVMFSPTARYFLTKTAGLGTLAPLLDSRIIVVSIVWILINLVMGSGMLPMPGVGGAGIAWEAHIGGYFGGLILLPLFDRWARGSTRAFPDIRS